MRPWITIALCFFFLPTGQAQKFFSSSAVVIQYAGSTGWMSTGFSKTTPNKKWEAGLLYGYVPPAKGGTLHTLSAKFAYHPFHIKLNSSWSIEPLQAGVFVVYHFGPSMGFRWEKYYPKGYYWWSKNFRQHLYIGTQATYHFDRKKIFDRLSFYIEANTNDLYLYSYFANLKAFKPTDIFFLGAGIKTYLK